ncbi:hypothetical protein Pmi06nite_65420 [Planotetraspora mira]|uniref:Uncharacterized protein n=2 Tax=Planotetraspora mira TaxID=58121 RepID=A0A8J3TUB7_9ACTN|nr:hypothetical protein Pmi06nite_65420 [Planotetraspora mira]
MSPSLYRMRPPSRFVRFAPAALGLVLGVLALGPALGPGFTLRYDMVFVPDPVWGSHTGGFPRAVPSDQVVALLSAVVPGQIVQKAVLLGIFVLAASGAAALVPSDRTAARLAAAAFYAWNAYLAQRLLLGQWALLLGFAGLPWAVRAAARGGVLRLAAALLPAAVGGFQAMLVTAVAVLPVAAFRSADGWRARVRGIVASAATMAVLSLPWLVPALRSDAIADPAGVAAFAPRADGPFGTLGSLLCLGGIWNAEAGVPGQGSWGTAAVRLVLSAVALTGFVRQALRGRLQGDESYVRGLAVAAAAGLVIACTGAFAPRVLQSLMGVWAGFGPFRDGQLYIAPLALALAVGFAAAVTWLDRAAFGRIAFAAAAVPVLALPTFALGAFGRLGSAEYPDGWRAVQAIVNHDPAPGALVSLPWGAYRAFGWNEGRVVLDPATKSFARRVVWDDALVVGVPGGGRIRVASEDPLNRRVGALVSGSGPLTAAFADEGVRYVLVESRNQNAFLSRLPGAIPVWRDAELLLIRL